MPSDSHIHIDVRTGDAVARIRELLAENSFSSGGAPTSPRSEVTEPTARGGAAAGATPGQTKTGGVVDAIDAAVEELCGCGCKERLRPDGPSAYFASQECQSRWANSQAHDPGEVYRRDDANWPPEFPGLRTRAPVPGPPRGPYTCPVCRRVSHNPHDMQNGWCGNCQAYTRTPRQLSEAPVPVRWWDTPAGTVRAIGYRSFCRGCERFRHPEPIEDLRDIVNAFSSDPHTHIAGPSRGCRVCAEPFPYLATIMFMEDPPAVRFVLEYGTAKVVRDEDEYTLRIQADIRSYADRIWQGSERDMEAQLRQQVRRYRGVPITADPAEIIRATVA